MTTTEILAFFQDLTDDVGSPPLWSESVRLRFLAEAQDEACRRARLLEDEDTPAVCEITLVPGTSVYDVDPRVILIKAVSIDGQHCVLKKVDRRDMDLFRPGWKQESQTPEPLWWMPWGNQQIRIETPSAVGTLRLLVVRSPLDAAVTPTQHAVTSITQTAGLATLTLTTPFTGSASIDQVTVAGAVQADYNGTHTVTRVSSTVFTFPVDVGATTPATGTITATFAGIDPEILPRYHYSLVDWMIYRALSMRDKEEKYDPKSAADHLAAFEAEFGKRSSAIDETWIQRKHGYDEYEGVF